MRSASVSKPMSYKGGVLDRPVHRGPPMARATLPEPGAQRLTLDALLAEAR